MKTLLRFFIFYFGFTTLIFAQGLPVTSPENVGLSSERFKRLETVMTQYLEKKQIAGAVALVVRKGKVAYFKSIGMQEVEMKKPMQDNTIFRIASMTKPITSVAVMMLYEEGRFLLNDPIHKYLPEFKDMMVLNPERATNGHAKADSLVPAKRPITIRHLLSHTSGLTYHWNDRLGEPYKKAGIAHGLGLHNETLAANMKKLAKLPLLFHPGARILSRKSVELMTADFADDLNPNNGFGLGFGIRRTLPEGGELGSVGAYGWSGFWNTQFLIDPREQMISLVFTQLYPYAAVDLMDKFTVMVYQAVSD